MGSAFGGHGSFDERWVSTHIAATTPLKGASAIRAAVEEPIPYDELHLDCRYCGCRLTFIRADKGGRSVGRSAGWLALPPDGKLGRACDHRSLERRSAAFEQRAIISA